MKHKSAKTSTTPCTNTQKIGLASRDVRMIRVDKDREGDRHNCVVHEAETVRDFTPV